MEQIEPSRARAMLGFYADAIRQVPMPAHLRELVNQQTEIIGALLDRFEASGLRPHVAAVERKTLLERLDAYSQDAALDARVRSTMTDALWFITQPDPLAEFRKADDLEAIREWLNQCPLDVSMNVLTRDHEPGNEWLLRLVTALEGAE